MSDIVFKGTEQLYRSDSGITEYVDQMIIGGVPQDEVYLGEMCIYSNKNIHITYKVADGYNRSKVRFRVNGSSVSLNVPDDRIIDYRTNSGLTSCSYMFGYYDVTSDDECAVEYIINLPSTENVRDYTHMCAENRYLKRFDQDIYVNRSNTSFSGFFYRCSNLEYVDLTKFHINESITLDSMFSNCGIISSLDFSCWKNITVISAEMMFANYGGEEIILPKFNFMTDSNLSAMFYYPKGLKKLTIDLDMNDVGNVNEFFTGCVDLEHIDGKLVLKKNTNFNFSSLPLDYESIIMIINNLPQSTRTTTLTLKNSTFSSLNDTEISLATSKGWTIASV